MIIIPNDMRRYWTAGIILSAIGVIFVRVLAYKLPQAYLLYTQIFGTILAFSGLFLIAFGTSKKLKEREKAYDELED